MAVGRARLLRRCSPLHGAGHYLQARLGTPTYLLTCTHIYLACRSAAAGLTAGSSSRQIRLHRMHSDSPDSSGSDSSIILILCLTSCGLCVLHA